jgi:O-antigen ligase
MLNPLWAFILAIAAAIAVTLLPLTSAAGLFFLVALIILTLIHPIVGLGAALIAGPLGAYENVVLGALPLESGQLLFFAAVIGWLARSIARRRIILHRNPVNVPLIIFILAASLTLLDAVSLAFGIKELVKWLELTIAMLMVVDLSLIRTLDSGRYPSGIHFVPDKRMIRAALAILLLAGVSQASIGIWQFGIRGDGPDHFIILERFYRAFGTFMQPNPFGGFMGITASIAIGATAGIVLNQASKWRQIKDLPLSEWLWFGFVAGSALLTSAALLMSWSRGAWLGFAAAMVVLLFFLPKRRWIGVGLLLIACIFFLLSSQLNIIPESLLSRLTSVTEDFQIGDVRGELVTIENYAVIERLAHWQSGLDMAKENLVTGVGFGNYDRAYEDFALLNWPFALGHAHNYYINLLAEVGVIGLVAYLLLWTVIFVQSIRILQRVDWPQRGIALGLLAAWTAITIHHFVDKLYVNNMFIFFGVMLGLQQVLDKLDD